MNAPLTARDAFLVERATGLGGTDLAAILGYGFRTPVEVWMEKTGQMPHDDGSMRLRFGNHNEEFVAREYSEATGRRVQRYTKMLRHPDHPHILGHVDRLVIPEGAKIAAYRGEIRTDRGLECKTVDDMAYKLGEWGEPGTDEVPAGYLIQCTTYMALTGCPRWDLAALIGAGAKPLAIYHLARDRELEHEIIRRGDEWWRKHVVGNVAPEPTCEDDVALLYPQAIKREPVIASPEVVQMIADLKQLKASEKAAQEAASVLSVAIKSFMGAAGELIFPGTENDKKPIRLATWNNRKAARRFDLDAFVGHLCPGALPGEHALYIEDARRTFTVSGEPGRTFLIK